MTRQSLTNFVFIAVTFVFAVALSGCDENVDPQDPEGAYNLYKNAVWAGDAEAVWARLAPSTHEYFQEEYERLVEMDETIEKYLPATDHKIAREQAGSILTSEVKDGKGLFMQVFKPGSLKLDDAHFEGAKVEEIRINEDETAAELTTRGGDVYYLVKGEVEVADAREERWFVMLVRSSDAVKKQMNWLEANQSALQQTVEDLIAEETEEREAVIAELMKLEQKEEASDDATEEATEETTEDESDGG